MKKMILGLLATIMSFSASAMDMTVQCKDFSGTSVFEMVFQMPSGWEGQEATLRSIYEQNKAAFVPKTGAISLAKSRYFAVSENLVIDFKNANMVSAFAVSELVVGELSNLNLVLTLDPATNTQNFSPTIEIQLWQMDREQIYHAGLGIFPHGGVVPGTIASESVLCAYDSENYLAQDFKL